MKFEDVRIRTTVELSQENLLLWKRLPRGMGKLIINHILDQVREKYDAEGTDGLQKLFGKIASNAMSMRL